MNKHGTVYICHTYYHVFVSFLKELNRPGDSENADIILSTMSNDFETLSDRIAESGVFDNVYFFDEKRDDCLPEVIKWKKNGSTIFSNMIRRCIYTRKLAKAQAPYIPVDLKRYKNIYVFCDADPIGYYLNMNHIYYHAVEDGLDTLSVAVYSKYDNRSHWNLKKFLSKSLNFIFIRDGYGKYCLDMEVNNRSVVDDDPDVYVEVSRNKLIDSLDDDQKKLIIKVFVKKHDKFLQMIAESKGDSDNILVLTEPLTPSMETREKIFRDIIETYSSEGRIFIKPHPRDELDYPVVFSDIPQFDKNIPMEIFNFFDELKFKKVISVYTQLGSVRFATEKVFLGNEFMDRYEDPAIHNR